MGKNIVITTQIPSHWLTIGRHKAKAVVKFFKDIKEFAGEVKD